MKVSVKNRADGTVFQVELDANATIGELRSKIVSHVGDSCDQRSLKLSLGAQLLDYADSVTLKSAGIVSGDRLFMEIGSHTSEPMECGSQVSDIGTCNVEHDPPKKSDDEIDATIEFRDNVVRATRDYLEGSGYSNSSLQSWSSTHVAGAELGFELRARNRALNIFVVITTLPLPSLSAIVNVGRVVDLSRKLLSSFTVQPASIKDNVISGVAVALSASEATGVTLIHLLSLRCIREQILMHMVPRAVTRLSGVNRLLRSILQAPSVDRTFWLHVLSRDFGQMKVQEAQSAGKTFRNKYEEEYSRQKSVHRGSSLLDHAYTPPIFRPDAPIYQPQPIHPNPSPNPHGPLFPAPDPLQPIPDPMNPLAQPPRVNPFGPGAPFPGQGGPLGPFGGRNNFDPFDPDNREIFPGRPNQGIPRGGPRHFPANRWDRNDFI
ncbi:hypothetical protein V3C99_008562 [Haemonchus contortus]|nr:Protein F09E5.7 [Haemonchus contortus]